MVPQGDMQVVSQINLTATRCRHLVESKAAGSGGGGPKKPAMRLMRPSWSNSRKSRTSVATCPSGPTIFHKKWHFSWR